MANPTLVERVALLCLHTSPLAPLGSPDAGGMNLYVLRLADGLTDLGIGVDVFTRRADLGTPGIVERPGGARLIHLSGGPAEPTPKRILPLHIPAYVRSLRSFVDSERVLYDIWHSHYWLSGLTALRAREDPRVPVIHMFHTLAKVKERFVGQADEADSALRVDGERCLINSVDVVVGATPEEEHLMRDLYGRNPRHYEVIPPGVDLRLFRPHDRDESRTRMGMGDGRIILFVGRLDRIKGFDILLQSLAILRCQGRHEVRVLVLGGHGAEDGPASRHLRDQVTSLGLGEQVEFRGIVPQDHLPYYFSAADVCAMPSAYESFGMVAIESMACQTPVVATNVGGLASTIQDGKTGFLAAPGDPDAFAVALDRALSHPDLSLMGRQARFSVRRYDWAAIVERTLSLYEHSVAVRTCLGNRAAGQC